MSDGVTELLSVICSNIKGNYKSCPFVLYKHTNSPFNEIYTKESGNSKIISGYFPLLFHTIVVLKNYKKLRKK